MMNRMRLFLATLLVLTSCAADRHDAPTASDDRVTLSPGLWIDRDAGELGFRAWVCLDAGWLEQVVCAPGTREHETLMVTDVPASGIHAGLLLLGLEPGSPGRWRDEGDTVVAIPPVGPELAVTVRWEDEDGEAKAAAVSQWIQDVTDRRPYPTDRWIFAGSIELGDEAAEQAGVRYLADRSGSIIGLVTFGDEVLSAMDVIPDAADVHPPEWVADTGAMPPVGTSVTVLLRTADAQTASE